MAIALVGFEVQLLITMNLTFVQMLDSFCSFYLLLMYASKTALYKSDIVYHFWMNLFELIPPGPEAGMLRHLVSIYTWIRLFFMG